MNARWKNDEERRIEDHREFVIYRFEHPAGAYCYIGLTANLDRRIALHCSELDGPLYSFLSRYKSDPGEARRHFRIIDRADGFRVAEEKESVQILSAFLEACDPSRPLPRNRRTHQIGPESFGKIVALAEHARAAHGIHENSQRVDETERRLKHCRVEKARLELQYKNENGRLTRLVDTEAASRKHAEGQRQTYQIICALLVSGLIALLAFGPG